MKTFCTFILNFSRPTCIQRIEFLIAQIPNSLIKRQACDFLSLWIVCSVYTRGKKKRLCDIFQPTAVDFSPVLTNEDGALLPDVREEHKRGHWLCSHKMHLPGASSHGSRMRSGDPPQQLTQMWHFCSFQSWCEGWGVTCAEMIFSQQQLLRPPVVAVTATGKSPFSIASSSFLVVPIICFLTPVFKPVISPNALWNYTQFESAWQIKKKKV